MAGDLGFEIVPLEAGKIGNREGLRAGHQPVVDIAILQVIRDVKNGHRKCSLYSSV
jgi:hypothetical protein